MLRRRWWLTALVLALLVGSALAWWLWPDNGDPRLRAFVHSSPPVPIVFTSRTEAASFQAAAPEFLADGYVYPGKLLWHAAQGRLRLLTPRGAVHELTWHKPLPDGGTLIDVMGPSVSTDGTKIIFAGRRDDDHGHFRLYEIGVDGRGLRQLTGGPDDAGCTAVPPMRFAADGKTVLTDAERKRIDYDDVDPCYADASNQLIAFASSRTPDLGRGHKRRSTTIWLMNIETGKKHPLTANRYNDRWPYLMTSNYLAFSLWSKNQEVITADEKDILPQQKGVPSATDYVDNWMGAFIQTTGGQFGSLAKTAMPVWRPRPLFNGRVVFMTKISEKCDGLTSRIVATDPGLLDYAPSSQLCNGVSFNKGSLWSASPLSHDVDGKVASKFATPSPCPPRHVVFAGSRWNRDSQRTASNYGIYMMDQDNWEGTQDSLSLLFDDPDLVDAEPVAVYVRHSKLWPTKPAAITEDAGKGEGTLFNSGLYAAQHADLPGQKTDKGEGPIFGPPPKGSIHSIRVYASHRDRFDDPLKLRVPGEWELLVDAPVTGETFGTRIPAGVPTVLAGFDKAGRVVRWTTPAKDSQGKQAEFYAFAGDHYSAAKPMGKHFCIGCHPGHSSLAKADHHHAEKAK